MKKILNGKRYDTDTAEEMAIWTNTDNCRDFHYCCETLYRKRTGEYFLFGEGGPASRYAERVEQNMWTGGSQIMPMSYKAATEWAEEHLTGDEYEKIFGTVSEGDAVLNVTVPAEAAAIIRRYAEKNGMTLSAAVAKLAESLKEDM